MNEMIENFNLDDFKNDGMVFRKALVSHNLSIYQAEDCLNFCVKLEKMRKASIEKYEKYENCIVKVFKNHNYSDNDIKKFINEYIYEAINENGKKSISCISDNYTDISLYRTMLSIFYYEFAEKIILKLKEKRV